MAENIDFTTHPSQYRHWRFEVEGERATLAMNVQEEQGLRSDDYVLKLNSYDLGVDVELADAIQRLRFEHPQVKVLILTGSLDRVFCAGANIMMLRTSTHAFKVNFCKFTNETRLYIEDMSECSDIKTLCAINGAASGGGYELAMAADKILLVDDRSSAVSFPEVPLLGVLPGTGGLTRLVDKRKIRRDLADVFSTVAEGIKGKRALEWELVDAIAPLSKFDETCATMAAELADTVSADKAGRSGVELTALKPQVDDQGVHHEFVDMVFHHAQRRADITINVPSDAKVPSNGDEAQSLACEWWYFKMLREFDDCLLRLRVNFDQIGLVLLKTKGQTKDIIAHDDVLSNNGDHWFINEVRHFAKRVLKRLDITSKSVYSIVDPESCFAGTLLEMLLAGDRSYVLNDPDFPITMGVSSIHAGAFPMANGLTRLQTRFLDEPEAEQAVLAAGGSFDAEVANELGLCTSAPDEIDWEDELRVAFEERSSFSPDALTGMEANLRFPGPETMETKIFARLSAWQNWIFQRPNAVGERGALSCYGTPNQPVFNYQRT